MESFSVTHDRPAREAGPPDLAFEARTSADPTAAGGDAPPAMYQTWVTGRVQDSSTPQVLGLALSARAAAALARASAAGAGAAAADACGGDVGAHFVVVLVRSDMRPVEAWDDVAGAYAPLQVPQSTFAFSAAGPARVRVEVKRKHLPPSKNHGDVFFRLLVRLRADVAGSSPVAVSAPFRIFSKQSTAAPRPEPKRRRNPAPTKPFVAPFGSAAAAVVASLADAAGALSSSASVASADTDVTLGAAHEAARPGPLAPPAMPPPPRRTPARAAKRHRPALEDADEEAGGRARSAMRRPPGPGSSWESSAAASVPRAAPGVGFFSFPAGPAEEEDDDDTASDEEMASLERSSSQGSGSHGHADPAGPFAADDEDEDEDEDEDDAAPPPRPFQLPAGAPEPVAPPTYRPGRTVAASPGFFGVGLSPETRPASYPSASPPPFDLAAFVAPRVQ